jgi:CheY-like chemotaxis protein
MSSKPIMVIEDDEDIKTQILLALEIEGHQTISASNGREALDILNTLSNDQIPSCFLIDMMMPEMNGLEFLIEIENNYKSKFGSINVIIATAKGNAFDLNEIPRPVRIIRKPFDLDELYSAIEENIH